VDEHVDRRRGHVDARQPADREHRDERHGVEHGHVEVDVAPPHRPIQLNTFTAEGTAITSVETMKDDPSGRVHPAHEHVVAHTIQPRNAIAMIANTIEW